MQHNCTNYEYIKFRKGKHINKIAFYNYGKMKDVCSMILLLPSLITVFHLLYCLTTRLVRDRDGLQRLTFESMRMRP